MIIRLNKLHALIIAVIVISILFFAALKADMPTSPASYDGINLPIIMYHHVTQKDSRAGAYVIKTQELENDFKLIKAKGYTAVTVCDLIDYVDGKKQLPEKIIMITFDDGFESVYSLAKPLLEKYDLKAVVSPIGSVTETYSQNGDKNINYAYMTWDELAEADKSRFFEIQNHTYDMHYSKSAKRKGLSRMNGESLEDYRKALTRDLTKMQQELKNNSNINATAAVYPYGVYSQTTLDIVKSLGFRCTLVCEERINHINAGNSECLYNLGRFNRPSGISSEKFFNDLLDKGNTA